jgi:transcriptional regulator with XRE-family HTH domain
MRRTAIEPIYGLIAQKVQAELKKQNKTAEKLAYESDLSKALVYFLLAGKTRISIHSLKKIADGLEVPLKKLIP